MSTDNLPAVSSLPAWVEGFVEANQFDDRMRMIYRDLLNSSGDWLRARGLDTNPFAWMAADTAVYHYVLLKFRSSGLVGTHLAWLDYDRINRVRHAAADQLLKMADALDAEGAAAVARDAWLIGTRAFFHIIDAFPGDNASKVVAKQSWALMLEEHAGTAN